MSIMQHQHALLSVGTSRFLLVVLISTWLVLHVKPDTSPALLDATHDHVNRRMRGRMRVAVMNSYLDCAQHCSADPTCASFNYVGCGGLCQLNSVPRNQSCKQLLEDGYNRSGVYTIYPDTLDGGLQVYCDQSDNGGGWIVFQRRQDGTEDFYRDWDQYRRGFGNLTGEFWLGNDYLRSLTETTGKWTLQVDLEDVEGQNRTAAYSRFKVSGNKYVLNFGAYHGDAGDALWEHRNMPFTTKDNDNDVKVDENCAQTNEGAWWFKSCLWSHLNGRYIPSGRPPIDGEGIQWGTFQVWTHSDSLIKCSMKIREN